MAQVLDRVEAARTALAQKPPRWLEAYDLLSEADAEEPLGPDELELYFNVVQWARTPEDALPVLERAYAAQLQAGNKSRAARLAVELSHLYGSVKLQRSIGDGWLARATRLLEEEPEDVAHGYLALERGLKGFARSDWDEVYEQGKLAERIGKEHGDRGLEVRGLQRQGVALIYKGEPAEGRLLLDEAAAAAFSEQLEPYATLTVYCNAIGTCRDVAAFDQASQWTERAQAFCDENSLHAFPGLCRVNRAEVMRFEGKLAEAEEAASRAFEELQTWAPRFAAAAVYEIGEVRLRLGDLAKAEEAFRQADEIGRSPEPGHSLLLLARDNVAAALASITRALDDAGSLLERSRILPPFVEIAVAAGELDRAEEAAESLGSIAEVYDTTALQAAAEHARGQVLLARGDANGALRPLRSALRMWQATNARYESARARVLLGQAYRLLGDEDGAIGELEAAASSFDRLGARLDSDRVAQLLGREAGARVAKTFVFTDIVDSTRTLEVLGDEKWARALRWHDETLQTIVQTSEGEVVDHTGDGFFLAFDDPRSAVEAAQAFQRALAAAPLPPPDVRIGIHSDEATHLLSNYRGKGVHTAARIGAIGGAGEIVASRATVDGLPSVSVSQPRSVELKGLSEPVEVVSIDWR